MLAEFTGSGAQIGKSNTGHVTVDSTGLSVYSGSLRTAAFGSSTIIGGIYAEAYRIEITGSGLTLLRRIAGTSTDEVVALLNADGIKVCGHSSVIGERVGPEIGSTSVPNASQTNVPAADMTRLSLDGGTWLIKGQAIFAANSTGRRWMAIRQIEENTGFTIDGSQINQMNVGNVGDTAMATSAIVQIEDTYTYTLRLYQNSGDPLYADTLIEAVRIA